MRLEEACALIEKIEREHDVNTLEVDGVNAWPLLRYCLWLMLSSPGESARKRESSLQFALRCLKYLARVFRDIGKYPDLPGGPKVLFVSRPTCLQRLPDGTHFDRIMDPLAEITSKKAEVLKAYLAHWPEGAVLRFPTRLLRTSRRPATRSAWKAHIAKITAIGDAAGVGGDALEEAFAEAWESFLNWRETGRKLFRSRPLLKRMFLLSWYFPDMMGLIAAAREHGVETIDVQHGKQGRFQGMYSWFTRIPATGYALMPDRFWCWGRPSCEHILASSPERKNHLPFVGGFPWLDYYRRNLSKIRTESGKAGEAGKVKVLVTLQGRNGAHQEPIPDFIIEFLASPIAAGVHFLFRCHPNFPECPEYSFSRLQNVPRERFSISDGNRNLYDEILDSTHHITAFSSCCYEAQAFGVPTLLFGADSETIYSDEIQRGIFSWTSGRRADLEAWLAGTAKPEDTSETAYIESSIETAAREIDRIIAP